jgi:hypothetical protein
MVDCKKFYEGLTLEQKIRLYTSARNDSAVRMHNALSKSDYGGFLKYNSKYWHCEYQLDLLFHEKRDKEKDDTKVYEVVK